MYFWKIFTLTLVSLLLTSCLTTTQENKPFTYKDYGQLSLTDIEQDKIDISSYPIEDSTLFLGYKIGMTEQDVEQLTKQYISEGKFKKMSYYLTQDDLNDSKTLQPRYVEDYFYFAQFEGFPENPVNYIVPCSISFSYLKGIGLHEVWVNYYYPKSFYEGAVTSYNSWLAQSYENDKKQEFVDGYVPSTSENVYERIEHEIMSTKPLSHDELDELVAREKEREAMLKSYCDDLEEKFIRVEERIIKYLHLKYGEPQEHIEKIGFFEQKKKVWLKPQKMISYHLDYKYFGNHEANAEKLLTKYASISYFFSINYSWVSKNILESQKQKEEQDRIRGKIEAREQQKKNLEKLKRKIENSGV